MHPTGSGTCNRFNAQWESPHSGKPSVDRARPWARPFRTFIATVTWVTSFAFGLPGLVDAQGPIQPASYGSPVPPGGPAAYDYGPGMGYCPPAGAYGNGTGANTLYELLPPDRFSHHTEAELTAFSDAFQYAYLRVEYLNFDIDDPGHQIVGAPRATGNERGTFNAINPNSGAVRGLARLRTFDGVSQHRNNGVRGVFGLPTRIGTFEAGVSVLEQSGFQITDTPYVSFENSATVFPAVTLLDDGDPSDTTMILFSEGLNVSMKTDFFATEANLILNPLTPNQPLRIQPLFGFQYVRLWDDLNIFGTDIDPVDVNDPDDDIVLNHRIRSQTKNNVFAPQVGVRMEFVQEHFTLGVTPKFMMGFNRHRDQVFSEQIFSATEDRMTTHEESSEFSPGLDLSVYGRVHLGKHLSLFASYQLYYIDNISRASDNILYDSTNGTTPNIVLNSHQEGIFIDGVTVGAEFRFH